MAASKQPEIGPFRLAPWFSPRVWGRRDLSPWYPSTGASDPIGEAWLTGPECRIETGPLTGRSFSSAAASINQGAEFPLLVKLLFPREKLSVQVHPDDHNAQALGQPRGKTECWYVLEAEPGASVALGLQPGVTPDHVRAAIADGTLEDKLQWLPVTTGDMIFVDAGTIHAIGPGVVLLETQQTSDTTFRLYDYGRPRELHLEQGLAVLKPQTAAGKVQPRRMPGFTRLIEQTYFTVDRYDLAPNQEALISLTGPGCLVALAGTGTIETRNEAPLDLLNNQAVVLPASLKQATVRSHTTAPFVHCFAPFART